MSAIVGLFNRAQNPIPSTYIDHLLEATAHRGVDGQSMACDDGVALAVQHLFTTEEAQQTHGRLPRDSSGRFRLAFSGRIDNRAELQRKLDPHFGMLHESDELLVLRAYQRWKGACVDHLIGAFAFVVWDNVERTLFCARDFLGIKPFYYFKSGEWFIWCSEIRPIITLPNVPTDINEGIIAERLCNHFDNQSETLYAHVQRLPPAHTLTVTPTNVYLSRYWDSGNIAATSYQRDADYIERFRELLDQAVAARLRTNRRIAAQLSGGIDSSCIVVTADQLRTAASNPVELDTITYTFEDPTADESQYARAITSQRQGAAHFISCPYPTKNDYDTQIAQTLLPPSPPNDDSAMHDLVREQNIRVVLTGKGGDEWLSGSPRYLGDLIQAHDWPNLATALRDYVQFGGYMLAGKAFLYNGILPFFPDAVQRIKRHRLKVPVWIDDTFAKRVNLLERLQAPKSEQAFSSFTQAYHFALGTDGYIGYTNECLDLEAGRHGYELRQPLNDQRLVEFSLGLPDDLRFRFNQTRYIMRQSVKACLPHEISARIDKADFSPVFVKTFETLGGNSMLSSLPLSECRWVNPNIVHEQLRLTNAGFQERSDDYHKYIWPLWHVIALHWWRMEAC